MDTVPYSRVELQMTWAYHGLGLRIPVEFASVPVPLDRVELVVAQLVVAGQWGSTPGRRVLGHDDVHHLQASPEVWNKKRILCLIRSRFARLSGFTQLTFTSLALFGHWLMTPWSRLGNLVCCHYKFTKLALFFRFTNLTNTRLYCRTIIHKPKWQLSIILKFATVA